MKDEMRLDFQRRLSQCNKGEMIVILYDILFAYMEDAKDAHVSGDYSEYKDAIRQTQKTLDMLIGALDFKYEIAKELYRLYLTSKNLLEKAIYQNRIDGIVEADAILRPLYVAFCEVAKSDSSAPLMQNVQRICLYTKTAVFCKKVLCFCAVQSLSVIQRKKCSATNQLILPTNAHTSRLHPKRALTCSLTSHLITAQTQ